MPTRAFPIMIIVGLLLLAAATSLFTVSEAQLAIRTEFGAIVGTHYAPGLHAKWPWDQVVTFDRRILSQTYNGETFLTNDNRGLVYKFEIEPSRKEVLLKGLDDIASTLQHAAAIAAYEKAHSQTATMYEPVDVKNY